MEAPDGPRDESWQLTDEEYDDDPDEHDGRVDAVLLRRVELLAPPSAREPDGVDEEGVEDGQGDEGQTEDEDDVEPGMVELEEESVPPEGR